MSSEQIEKILSTGNQILDGVNIAGQNPEEVVVKAMASEVPSKHFHTITFLIGTPTNNLYLNITKKGDNIHAAIKGANPYANIHRTEFSGDEASIETVRECINMVINSPESRKIETDEYSQYDILTILSNPDLNPGKPMPRVIGLQAHDGLIEEWFNMMVPQAEEVSGFTGKEYHKIKKIS